MAQEQKEEEEEFEMQLGPLKTVVFAVRASSWTCRMAAYQKPFPFRSITLATSSSCWQRARLRDPVVRLLGVGPALRL